MPTTNLIDLVNLGDGSQNPALYAPNLVNVIDGANKFASYVQAEQTLLDKQKNLVNDAALAKSRQVALNESVRKRTQDYSYMMMIVCVFLGVLVLLAFLKPYMTFIPSILFDLLIIAVVAATVIYVIIALQSIYARDNIDYDTLNLPSPVINPQDSAAVAKAAEEGKLSDIAESQVCAGEECCAEGTTYDSEQKKCVQAAAQGMTTMNQAQEGAILPYTPSETTHYAFV